MSAASSDRVRLPRWQAFVLVLLALPVFCAGLASYGVVNGDEGIYHTIAAHMLESGDWTRLEYHGQDRIYDAVMNAPTQYWLRATLIALLGDGLWSMRLLSAACGVLAVLATWRLAAELDPERSRGHTHAGAPRGLGAFAAGLVLLTSFQFVYLHGARTGELDAIASFLLCAVALAFVRAVGDRQSFLVHHALLALLLTIKLPLVLVPVAAELALFATSRSARPHFARYAWSGLALLPLALAWHAYQAATRWGDISDVMAKMGGEAGGSVGGGEYSGGPLANLAWYAEKAMHGLYPWSPAMLLAAAALAFRRSGANRSASSDDRERFASRTVLFFALAVWLFFAAVSKRFPWYVMPSYPFAAVLIGGWVARIARAPRLADLALASVALALALWIDVPLAGVRPLVQRAATFPMEVGWRELGTPGSFFGVAVTAAAAFAVLCAVRARVRSPGLACATLFFVPLLLVAAARVALPLGSLAHESELERLHAQLDADRAAGRPIRYPIALPESEGWLRVQYYFGRDYLVRELPGRIAIEGERPRALE